MNRAQPHREPIAEIIHDDIREHLRRRREQEEAFWKRVPIDYSIPPHALEVVHNPVTGEGRVVARGALAFPHIPYVKPAG